MGRAVAFSPNLPASPMSVRFSVLMPSSEGKQPGGNPFGPDMFDYRSSNTFNYFNALNPERRVLIDALHTQIESGKDVESLFGLRGEALQAGIEANLAIYASPLMAAIERYGPGVVYQSAHFEELPTGAQRRLLENGIIFSGMFGLLRPDDLIPMHELRMDASVEGLGKVSKYWRPSLSPVLNELLNGQVVWNLLPDAHAEAWEDERSYEKMYRVKFFVEEKKKLKAVTRGLKELRGGLVSFIVTALAEDGDALGNWEADGGFEMDREASELGERGGTIVMVSRPGWEQRRALRRSAKAEVEAERRARREAETESAEE